MVPTNVSPNLENPSVVILPQQTASIMGDKVQSTKESGTESCHGRLSDGNSSQTSTSYGSSYGYRKQTSKGSYYANKDRKGHTRYQSHPKSTHTHNGSRLGRQSGRGQSQRSDHSHGNTLQNGGVNESNKMSPVSGVTPIENGRQGGKKKPTTTSLNHLLNFTIAPVGRSIGPGSLPPMFGARRRSTRVGHSFNKEQFLQANCQFVVSASGDYSVHSSDPDLLVNWDSIEQLRLFCHQIPSCPICLYPPRAAKITRCGHVYCWSCVLHYLTLGDKKWRKCPICYESIYKKDLKSVTALASHQYSIGDTLTMTLMARKKGTTLALPRESWADKKDGLLTLKDSSTNQFAKLLLATPTEVLALITNPERTELEAQLTAIDKDDVSEESFVEAALLDLKDRELSLRRAESIHQETSKLTKCLKDAESALNNEPFAREPPPNGVSDEKQSWTSFADNYFESEFESPFSEHKDQNTNVTIDTPINGECDTTQLVEPVNTGSTPLSGSSQESEETGEQSGENSTGSSSVVSSPGDREKENTSPRSSLDSDLVYFYQGSDGQHLYIHPVNAKCLMKEYGALEYSPCEVKATIVEIEQRTMSEDIRSRYRYLNHLPLTCELALVELDLHPPTLSRATLTSFSEEIGSRRQKRVKKKKEERRREKKAEAKEQRPEPTFIVPTSAHELTPEKFHDFLSLASSPTARSHLACTPPEVGVVTQRGGQETQDSEVSSAPSFAQALRGKPPPIWPIHSPTTAQWSTTNSTASGVAGTKKGVTDETDEELVPTYREAFNDALVSASVSVMAAQNVSGGKPGNKTAKKGRKKMVLFSTGSTRGTS